MLVEVGAGHLAGSKCRPHLVVAELIWDGQDADATETKVEIVPNEWDPPEQGAIRDNRFGMRPVDAVSAFGNFGNSSKHRETGTRGGRTLHSLPGQGRQSAFSFGSLIVSWMTENLCQKINDDEGRTR